MKFIATIKNLWSKWQIRFLLFAGTFAISGIVAVLTAAYLFLAPLTPHPRVMQEVSLQIPLKILTIDGKLIGEFGEQRRKIVTYEQLPEHLIHAIISAEDSDFFAHGGIDIVALVRATYKLIINRGKRSQGGGTITMQVARNYLLSRDKTFFRKFREILLALRLERFYQKKHIFEFYINYNFLGNRAYGVSAASEIYFSKNIGQLNLQESALLAGLAVAPSRLNPVIYPVAAKIRRDYVLRRMRAEGYLDEPTMITALKTPIQVIDNLSNYEVLANHAAEFARLEVLNKWGKAMYRDGYLVYTTIDSIMQNKSVEALKSALHAYDKRHGWRQPVNRIDVFSALVEAELNNDNFDAFEHFNKFDDSGYWITPPRRGERVLDAVNEYPNILDYEPGIVLAIQGKAARVLVRRGDLLTVLLEDDMKWAKTKLRGESFGPPPQLMLDLLRRGDVVWLDMDHPNPKLIQIPEIEGAHVLLDSHSGEIRAMVGGYSYNKSKFNRVTQAEVQLGSCIKPFIYSIALNDGLQLSSIFDDAPIVVEDEQLEEQWRPSNSEGNWLGPTRLREALVHSKNLVSIRLGRSLGIGHVRNDLSKIYGFAKDQMATDLSLTLGNVNLSPMQIAKGYSVLSNSGYRIEPNLVARIEDRDGNVVWRNQKFVTPTYDAFEINNYRPEGADAQSDLAGNPIVQRGNNELAKQVLDPRIAFLVSDVLREVITRGTARSASFLKRDDFAGKTGTTNGASSTWFCGYNGKYVSISWIGFDDGRALGNAESGAKTALPVWIDVAKDDTIPKVPFSRPTNIVIARIDERTGKLTQNASYGSIFELFLAESDVFSEQWQQGQAVDTFALSPEDIF